MNVLEIILAIVNILVALGIIYLVLQQSENDQGLGTLSGNSTDSFYSANKGRTKDVILRKVTTVLVVIFVVINIALGIMIG